MHSSDAGSRKRPEGNSSRSFDDLTASDADFRLLATDVERRSDSAALPARKWKSGPLASYKMSTTTANKNM
jgi:hypothetical protein